MAGRLFLVWTGKVLRRLPSLKLTFSHLKIGETIELPLKNGWLEDYFPFGKAYFQGRLLLVSGRVKVYPKVISWVTYGRSRFF